MPEIKARLLTLGKAQKRCVQEALRVKLHSVLSRLLATVSLWWLQCFPFGNYVVMELLIVFDIPDLQSIGGAKCIPIRRL